MSYSMASFAKSGLLDQLIEGIDADAPDAMQIERVRQVLVERFACAEADRALARSAGIGFSGGAALTRAASIEVRRRLVNSGMLDACMRECVRRLLRRIWAATSMNHEQVARA